MATQVLLKIGFAYGSMLGPPFLLLYAALTLYGSALSYRDLENTSCDPSDGVSGNETCDNAAPGVFGAMLGVEAFTVARVAVFEALDYVCQMPQIKLFSILLLDEAMSALDSESEMTVHKFY